MTQDARNNNNKSNQRSTGADTELDAASSKGIFGWERITDDLSLPVLIRNKTDRMVPIKIVEQELIKKYSMLPEGIFSCIHFKAFPMTETEVNHWNNINADHCDYRYGSQPLAFTDRIVAIKDVKELNRFLNVSKKKFRMDHYDPSDKLGIVQLSLIGEYKVPVLVPYITKSINNLQVRYVPQSLVQPYIQEIHYELQSSKITPTDWDIAYLKMLCIYGNIESTQLYVNKGLLLPLNELRDSFMGNQIQYEDWDHNNFNGRDIFQS